MNKIEKIQLSHSTIEWISKEITEVEYILNKLKTPETLTQEESDLYDSDDVFYLENRLLELKQRNEFETKNLKKLKDE